MDTVPAPVRTSKDISPVFVGKWPPKMLRKWTRLGSGCFLSLGLYSECAVTRYIRGYSVDTVDYILKILAVKNGGRQILV